MLRVFLCFLLTEWEWTEKGRQGRGERESSSRGEASRVVSLPCLTCMHGAEGMGLHGLSAAAEGDGHSFDMMVDDVTNSISSLCRPLLARGGGGGAEKPKF